jgi:hypothetical protein
MEYQINKEHIYKFVPISLNTLNLLIKGELWMGFPHNLNDPFEGEFILENFEVLPEDDVLREFYEKQLDYPDYQIKARLEEIKKEESIFNYDLSSLVKKNLKEIYGVSCFSKNINSILMWSHYANCHKGICLVFDQYDIFNDISSTYFPIGKFEIGEIDYNPDLIRIKPYVEGSQIRFHDSDEIFLQKLKDWEYENEYRIICKFYAKDTKRSLMFKKKNLKAIIFGDGISDDDRNTIIHLIKNDSNYNITWGSASKDLENLTMKIKQHDYAIIKTIDVKIERN